MTDLFSAIILDDSRDQKIPELLRTKLGIDRVDKCSTTIDALHVINEFSDITIIFIDYETTLSRTFSFVKEAKDTGNCDETKFFLMANESSQEFLSEASKNGISAFILKPFKSKRFIDKSMKLLPNAKNRKQNRVNLLDSVEALLRYKNKEVAGTIENINDLGCAINTIKFGRMGAEVYDTVTIRINFENERLGINAELIKIEQDPSKGDKAITSTFKFKKPDEENAMQFAKFWAHILKERKE